MADAVLQQELQVRISDDAMLAELRVPAGFAPELLSEELCTAFFCNAGVSQSRELVESIRKAVGRFQKDPQTEVSIECRGKLPIAGANARLEWVPGFDPFTPPATAADDDHTEGSAKAGGKADYYNKSYYVSVAPNQHVATMLPATLGEEGHSVTGKPLPPTAGKELSIKTDETVLLSGDKFIAQEAGVLQFEDDKILISRHLTISDYVDFSTGHIDFDGDVEIKRGVRDKFIVRATGNIDIEGLIEAAVIEAGGDLEAHTGMAAKETGHIKIGGSLTTKYLECVHGTITKDAHIHRGIVQCELDVCGDLDVQTGAIQGGITRVTGAAHVGQLGSPAAEKTMIVLGYAGAIQTQLALTDQYIEETEQRCAHITTTLKTLTDAKADRMQSQREMMTEMMCEASMLEATLGRIKLKRDRLVEYLDQIRKVDLTVEKVVHPGTTVVVDEMGHTFDDPLKGPLWIGWNAERELVVKNTLSGSVTPISQITQPMIMPRQTVTKAPAGNRPQ